MPIIPKESPILHEDNQDEREILDIGSPTATLRLLKDLKSIKNQNPEHLVMDQLMLHLTS